MWESSGLDLDGSVAGLSRTRADRLRRKTELPGQRAQLPMVAFHRADVYSRQPDSSAGEHVQPDDGWTIRGETLRFGKVCRVLGADWNRRPDGELSDSASATCNRVLSHVLFSRRKTSLRRARRVLCLDWSAFFSSSVSSFVDELPEGFKRAFGTGMLPIIFINLFIGFVGSGFIDNAAHLGGLLSGAVLALGVDYRRPGVRATDHKHLARVADSGAVGSCPRVLQSCAKLQSSGSSRRSTRCRVRTR